MIGEIGRHIADEVEGEHKYRRLALVADEEGRNDMAAMFMKMADEEGNHARHLMDMLDNMSRD